MLYVENDVFGFLGLFWGVFRGLFLFFFVGKGLLAKVRLISEEGGRNKLSK